MITELSYKSVIYKIDTSKAEDREIMGNINQSKFEDFLTNKGYSFVPIENKYSNWDYYKEVDDNAIIIELKSTTKDIDTFDTELINISKIKGIYNKYLSNKKRNIKTTILIIYAYKNDVFKLLKVNWKIIKTLQITQILNKDHYLLDKNLFEPIENIDKYINIYKELKAH